MLTPGLGGHTRTAMALANALRDRGHQIDFLVRESADSGRPEAVGVTAALMREGGFAVIPTTDPYSSLGRTCFRQHLHELIRRTPYDALHWFEIHAGVRDAALVASAERRAFLWTVTSGGVPPGYCGLNRVVVYTAEVAEDVRRRSPTTAVHVLPARFDLRSLDAPFVERARREIRQRLAMSDHELLIVRVARCASVYLRSIRAGVALARQLTSAGRHARFLHAGYVEDPSVAAEIRETVNLANASTGRTLAWTVMDNLEPGTRYAAAADVCIGSGRSAIESVALKRPTLVAWGSRYLGLIDRENLEAIAATNFQGRNSERVFSDDDVVQRMRLEVVQRLSDKNVAEHIHDACSRFVRARYAVDEAAQLYEQLYVDRTVTVDGPLKYYANLHHLRQELFHRLPSAFRLSRPVNWFRRARVWPGAAGSD